MKRLKRNTGVAIKSATQEGTTFYKITLDQLKSFYNNEKNIIVRYVIDQYGFEAFDLEHMYGSVLDGDTLYLCVTDGYEISVNGESIDPESALEDYSTEDLSSYIQDGTDEIINRYLSEYELNSISADICTELVQDGYDFIIVLEAARKLDMFDDMF